MTRVFGVLGYPISHSLSPVMHRAAFHALGLDALYAPFEVPPAQLGKVLRGLRAAGIDGLNVTVPLKERVVRYADRLVDEAKVLRAVNTLLVRDGRLIGYNTDVIGFLRALKALGWTPRPCAAVILGAGGTAKAVAWALTRYPRTTLTIVNRHPAGARRLARWLMRHRPACQVVIRSLQEVSLRGQELLINATSVGMSAGDSMIIDAGALHRDLVVYDVVYNRLTPLVRAAQRRGCLAANGVSMLVYQGAESFRLWWRREPPITAMRRAVEEALCRT